MEYILVVAVVAAVIVAWFIEETRSRKAVQSARRERAEIYRSCFLRGLAGILARMAKADGTVSLEEVDVATRLFNDMGLDPMDRDLCYESFKIAKDSNLPMSYYASLFAPYSTRDSRVLVYEILWDITAADGKLDPGERKSLESMIGWLSLDQGEFNRNERRVAGRFSDLSAAAKSAGAKIEQVLHA